MTAPKILAALESYDLQCAVHRWEVTLDPGEIAALTTPQLITTLRITRADPSWPIWKLTEGRLGRPITPKDLTHGNS
jgi:hypothetical protein